MTPEGQARVFRPIWQGLEMARVILDELTDEIEARADLNLWDRIAMLEEVARTRAFIDLAGGRFSHAGLECALEDARGRVLTMPPLKLAPNAQAEAVASLYAARPQLRAKAEARAKAQAGGYSALAALGESLAANREPAGARNVAPLERRA